MQKELYHVTVGIVNYDSFNTYTMLVEAKDEKSAYKKGYLATFKHAKAANERFGCELWKIQKISWISVRPFNIEIERWHIHNKGYAWL